MRWLCHCARLPTGWWHLLREPQLILQTNAATTPICRKRINQEKYTLRLSSQANPTHSHTCTQQRITIMCIYTSESRENGGVERVSASYPHLVVVMERPPLLPQASIIRNSSTKSRKVPNLPTRQPTTGAQHTWRNGVSAGISSFWEDSLGFSTKCWIFNSSPTLWDFPAQRVYRNRSMFGTMKIFWSHHCEKYKGLKFLKCVYQVLIITTTINYMQKTGLEDSLAAHLWLFATLRMRETSWEWLQETAPGQRDATSTKPRIAGNRMLTS